MRKFVKGLTLCEGFFNDIAKPILDAEFPQLIYTAGLIGYGSDVLGYDDTTSTDHMWGPRFYLFLKDRDIGLKNEILAAFSKEFPYTYQGYSVHFSEPDPIGVRQPVNISSGSVSPLLFIYTINDYLKEYLGMDGSEGMETLDWLSFSEHRLLALTSGKIFIDGLNLKEKLDVLSFYPEEVQLFLIASNWSIIAEEEAFVRRCADVGDEIGSILVCTRIADRLMRLAFLYCKQYAPYSKWFGKAFCLLPIDDNIKTTIQKAVTATTIEEREKNLVLAQKLLAKLHNDLHITDAVDVKIQDYFGRKMKVIHAEKFADATIQKLAGTPLAEYPLIGTLSQVANLVALSDEPQYRENVKALFRN